MASAVLHNRAQKEAEPVSASGLPPKVSMIRAQDAELVKSYYQCGGLNEDIDVASEADSAAAPLYHVVRGVAVSSRLPLVAPRRLLAAGPMAREAKPLRKAPPAAADFNQAFQKAFLDALGGEEGGDGSDTASHPHDLVLPKCLVKPRFSVAADGADALPTPYRTPIV